MKRYLFFILVLISACSGSKKVKSDTIKILDTDFVSLQKTPCYGTCPVYKVSIYGNGHVVYEGERFVDNLGTFNGSISVEEAQKLFQKIENYDWNSFPDTYPIDNYDFPQFFIGYNTSKFQRNIKANSLADKNLIDLASYIEGLIQDVSLKKINE